MASKDAQRIRNYVQALGRDDRYILMLYYADGLTPLEIGVLLGRSASSVDSRLGYFRHELGGLLHLKPGVTGGPRPTAFA